MVNPFNIFVYADMDYKIKRCQTYAEADENLTPAELKKMIKKVVIPAAGLGTRFLPFTKTIAKEMLPIIDRPNLQYLLEEAKQSGIEEVILIWN